MTDTMKAPVTEFQRWAAERAVALARELEAAAAKAPDGKVIQGLEAVLLSQGRDHQRQMLERMMQDTADEAVKKGGAPGPAPAGMPAGTRARRRGRS